MDADCAEAAAVYIRDPVSEDDDAHEARVFTLDLHGAVADMDHAEFVALRPKSWCTIRGRRVYVTRRLADGAIEVYDDEQVAYRVVVAP
jgi:hypothetical protein